MTLWQVQTTWQVRWLHTIRWLDIPIEWRVPTQISHFANYITWRLNTTNSCNNYIHECYALSLGITLVIWSMSMNCTHGSSCFGSSYHTNLSSSYPLKNAEQHWYSSSMILGSSPRATPSLAAYNRNSQPVNAWPSTVAHFLSISNSSRAQSNAEVRPMAWAYDDLRVRMIHNLRSTWLGVRGWVIASSSRGVSWDGGKKSIVVGAVEGVYLVLLRFNVWWQLSAPGYPHSQNTETNVNDFLLIPLGHNNSK